jgi:hypothetical protein
MSGSRNSGINILGCSSLNGGEDRLIIGIDDIKGLIFGRVNKSPIDEELLNKSKFGNIHLKISYML